MKPIQLFLSFLLIISGCQVQDGHFNILDFGAKKGGTSTQAIQRAVDACYKAGGGKVVIPSGLFITGTIVLKSNVNLFLDNGAELRSSTNPDDFLRTFNRHGIIFCEDAENISISGEGTINGLGSLFYETDKNHIYEEFDKQLTRQKENYMPKGEFFTDGPLKRKPMPGMSIVFFHCTRVKVSGIKVKDTPVWAFRFGYCDDVVVDGISVQNNKMIPNSDGIHCTASRNIRISNCNIVAGDDAIIITGFPKDEETPGYNSKEQDLYIHGNKSLTGGNLQVTNCYLQSRSSAIRVGYGQHPIKKCIFSNIIIAESNRGIGVFAHDEASIEDLIFSDITIDTRLHNGQWWGNGEPIHLSSVSRFEKEPPGLIKNVQFTNVVATGENGIILYAQKLKPMQNITFNNVRLHLKSGKETEAYGGNFDLRPVANPQLRLFEHDIPGVFARYVNNLSFDDFRLTWGDNLPGFYSNGIELEYCSRVDITNYWGRAAFKSDSLAALKITNTTGFTFVQTHIPEGYKQLIK